MTTSPSTATGTGRLSAEELRVEIASGTIDTVVVAFTDMQGRLQGKRMHAGYFLDQVLDHGTEGCNYLLAVDVDMNTVGGYAISSWESGYGDMEFQLDLGTLRWIPWLPATVMIQCDLAWLDANRSPVTQSPRQVLKRQAAKAASLGMVAFAGTELEFIVFDDTYEQAWSAAYRGLTPSNQYNVDYSLLGTARIEPLLRAIRNGMQGAGLPVESVKGECNLGQHEIAFRFDEVV
ncbi:MAG: glutamine synthetase, partial [Propionibacteriales bacterium]|nr:glutamine synthetase [Propionibacteriales bacterium]